MSSPEARIQACDILSLLSPYQLEHHRCHLFYLLGSHKTYFFGGGWGGKTDLATNIHLKSRIFNIIQWLSGKKHLNHWDGEERLQFSFLNQSSYVQFFFLQCKFLFFFFNVSFLMQMEEQRKGEVGEIRYLRKEVSLSF